MGICDAASLQPVELNQQSLKLHDHVQVSNHGQWIIVCRELWPNSPAGDHPEGGSSASGGFGRRVTQGSPAL